MSSGHAGFIMVGKNKIKSVQHILYGSMPHTRHLPWKFTQFSLPLDGGYFRRNDSCRIAEYCSMFCLDHERMVVDLGDSKSLWSMNFFRWSAESSAKTV